MSENQQRFQSLLSQGHSAIWDQDWSRAADFYRQALEEIPDHPLALSSLGLAYLELKDLAGAMKCYQRVAALTPDDPGPVDKIAHIYELEGKTTEFLRTLLQAAELYLKNRDVERAVQNWRQVLRIQPNNLAAHSRLAVVYERQGHRKEAVLEYLAIASVLQRAGDLPNAYKAVQRAMQIHPESDIAARALAILRANQPLPSPTRPRTTGRLRRGTPTKPLSSSKQVEKKAEQDPLTEACQLAMVQLAALLFEQSEAVPNADPLSRRGLSELTRGTGGLGQERVDQSRIQLHLGQAIDSQSLGKNDQAAAELERVIDIGLTHPAIYFNLGWLLMKKDSKRAVTYLQKSVQHPDYGLASCLLMGQIYQEQGQWVEAANSFLKALKLADMETTPTEYNEEVDQLYEAYRVDQGETDVDKLKEYCNTIAPQLIRSDWRQFLEVARQQASIGQAEDAIVPLAQVLLESRSSEVLESLATIRKLIAINKLSTAMEEAFHALQFAPTYLPLHILIGEMLLKEGHSHQAVEKFMLVAQLYNLRGETGNAIRLLSRAIKMAPMDLSMRGRLIEMLISQERMDEAIQQYLDLAGIYYALAELDMARQTYQAATRLTQRSSDHQRWSWELLTKMVDIDMQRLEWKQAYHIFEQLKTLNPEHPLPRRQLISIDLRLSQDGAAFTELDAYISLLENAGKRTQAIQFTKDLLAEEPSRIEVRKRLAELFIRNGERVNAVRELDLLADALLNAGDHLGAIAMVQRIIEMNPPNVADYENALEQMRKK